MAPFPIVERPTALSTDGTMVTNDHRPQILDIRHSKLSISLEDEIIKGMKGEDKKLPTLLLYSAQGLKIFEDITYVDDYYLTNTEIEVLKTWADAMAERIADDSMIIELGSGNLRKVNILLSALDRQGKKISYYALDLDRSELERTLSMLPPGTFKHVSCYGLHGTYEDGKAWLNSSQLAKNQAKCILWLGSSAGNFSLPEIADFLKGFADDALRAGERDYLLVGLDGCMDEKKVMKAYHDLAGITDRFIMEGLNNANRILGEHCFDAEDWEYVGQWNKEEHRHEAFYMAKKDMELQGKLAGVRIEKGEKVWIEYSVKFSDLDARYLWDKAGLIEGAQWADSKGDYYIHMLYKPTFSFPLKPSKYASQPVPTLKDWRDLWAAWDSVTLGMIPTTQLHSKPIDLRNPCIFYLGHIPTFLDVQLCRALPESPPTAPESYTEIFQRGIDPDVDDPTKCHSHSLTPDQWPELDEILEYQARVRARARGYYDEQGEGFVKIDTPMVMKRALWVAFEHEAMHLETLLYMLLQSDATLPPPGAVKPDFISGRTWERRGTEDGSIDGWVEIPDTTIVQGMNDPEEPESDEDHFFGWDNEKPVQEPVKVKSFTVRSRPITNEEYALYLRSTHKDELPVSWFTPSEEADKSGSHDSSLTSFISSKFIRTVFGSIPLRLALDWPVVASYDELAACAAWYGGRIPEANEVRAIYRYAESLGKEAEKKIAKKIDAVNGHLVHNGVCESPPDIFSESREALFSDLSGKNVGFKNWHPTSVRSSSTSLGDTGGAWEWTSTTLTKHQGFKVGKLYPEYTSDFFDGKHNIALGGSWATHPRIAGRKTFVNWYQRNYRYMWATARIAKSMTG